MKRVLKGILYSTILLLSSFSLVKSTNSEEIKYNTNNLVTLNNGDYTTIKKENTIIKTDDKSKKKKAENKAKKIITKKKEYKNNNETKKVSTKKTTTKTTTKKTTNTVKYGTYGRLYVSSYNVALYDYNVNTNSKKSLQTIVNDKDSAAYYITKNKLVIADHNYQGFNILINLKVGTTSYIKFKNGKTIKYKMIKKSKGTNTGPDLIDTKGNSFFNMESDIIMYTCYNNGIMVTLWTLA